MSKHRYYESAEERTRKMEKHLISDGNNGKIYNRNTKE